MDQIFALALTVGHFVWNVANSNFTTALAGAGAGAYAAQWIVERRDEKRRLLEEIRATNTAITVAFEIVNAYCGLKLQHVRKLKTTFDAQRNEFDTMLETSRSGTNPQPIFELKADFETLPVPQIPTSILQALLFEKISIGTRPLSLFLTLCRCVDGFAGAARQRQSVIDWCKQNSPVTPDVLLPLYFGLPDQLGQQDRTYADCVAAIASYTDDCPFFCKSVMDDLVKHGQRLAKRYGRTAPIINQPDFTKAIQLGLIPDEKNYADVLGAFKSAAASAMP